MYDINNISNIETTIYEEGFVEKANEITDKLNCFNFEYIKSLKVDLKNEYQMIYFRKSSYPSDAFLIRIYTVTKTKQNYYGNTKVTESMLNWLYMTMTECSFLKKVTSCR